MSARGLMEPTKPPVEVSGPVRPATGPQHSRLRAPRPRRGSREALALIGLVLVAHLFVVLNIQVPVLRPLLGLGALLGVPTLTLAARLSWGVRSKVERFLYALGASVLGVLLIGLGVNFALPVVGIARPLAPTALSMVSIVLDVCLIVWARTSLALPEGAVRVSLRRAVVARTDPAVALGVLSLLLAVIGAVRLNNGRGSMVAVAGVAAGTLAFVVLLLRRRDSRTADLWTIFFVGLALLLATSLRGWQIIGHDIQREYLVYQLTQRQERWQMGYYVNAYNACLSLNIWPTVLAGFSGLSGTVVFKVLCQFPFAVVPVLSYLFSRRVLDSRRAALLTVVLLASFPTFANDMPFMVRQETAFFFVALVMLAVTQPEWSRHRRQVAIVLAGIGMVLSHYATTYVLLATVLMAASAYVLVLLLRRLLGRPRRKASRNLLTPAVVGALIAVTWVWTGPVTESGGHFVQTMRETATTFLSSDSSKPGSSDLAYSLFAGNTLTPQQRLDQYAELEFRETAPGRARGDYLPLPERADAFPTIAAPDQLPLTEAGRAVNDVVDVPTVNAITRAGAAKLLQLFLLVGVAGLFLGVRGSHKVPVELRYLALGSIGALAIQVLAPDLSVEYGVLRAFQQTLVVIGPAVAIGALTIGRVLGRRGAAATAGVAMVLYASLTGLLPSVLGGYPAQLSLSNSGPYYDIYYVSAGERDALTWLGRNVDGEGVQSEIVNDRFTVNRLQSFLREKATTNEEFFPSELRPGSYVFAGAETVRSGKATVGYSGDLLTYRYPMELLDDSLDTVYSNPDAEVFR